MTKTEASAIHPFSVSFPHFIAEIDGLNIHFISRSLEA
jgi:hypothetical protein